MTMVSPTATGAEWSPISPVTRSMVLVEVLLQVDDAVGAEVGQPPAGGRVQADQVVAGGDVEDPSVRAVVEVGQPASGEPARRRRPPLGPRRSGGTRGSRRSPRREPPPPGGCRPWCRGRRRPSAGSTAGRTPVSVRSCPCGTSTPPRGRRSSRRRSGPAASSACGRGRPRSSAIRRSGCPPPARSAGPGGAASPATRTSAAVPAVAGADILHSEASVSRQLESIPCPGGCGPDRGPGTALGTRTHPGVRVPPRTPVGFGGGCRRRDASAQP